MARFFFILSVLECVCMRVSDFDYFLSKDRIAQASVCPRDHSKLMALDRKAASLTHAQFFDIGKLLQPGDLLVRNVTKVLRARLFGWLSPQDIRNEKVATIELLVLHESAVPNHQRMRKSSSCFEALIKPLRKLRIGDVIYFGNLTFELETVNVTAILMEVLPDGVASVQFNLSVPQVFELCHRIGHIPVPPYIEKEPSHEEHYQTVYAHAVGSVAAPTAGFHFTHGLIGDLLAQGSGFAEVVLHVGVGTFRPMKTETIEEHAMHAEYVELTENAIQKIRQTKIHGGRVIAVGTTTVRVLEGVYASQGKLVPFSGNVSIFITPGFTFRVIDGLITNFHLPKSTLLPLVCAFAGKEFVLRAYDEAITKDYRFYSFGDAMLIV